MNNLALCLWKRGDYLDAIPLYREAVELNKLAGRETAMANSSANLGGCLDLVGKFAEADRVLGDSLERASKRFSADHQETDRLRWLQIRVWIDQGHVERAVALGREALGVRRRIYTTGHPMIAAALMDFGRGLVLLGRSDEAEAHLHESLTIFARSPTALSAHYPAWSECWLGASLAGRRRYTEAAPRLLNAEKLLREARTTPHWYYREAVEQLVKLYEASGKPDQAAQWRAKLAALGDSQRASEGKGGKP
jgi:tetratricopeptide (TPR) repeat protein